MYATNATTKLVNASLVSTAHAAPVSPTTTICEGWVEKKRRKRMQGFARRYFTLTSTGVLSYSFEPGQPQRDQILLSQAAVATAPGRRDIHIDSHTGTFHIRCLSREDFEMWMGAFRKILAIEIPKSRRSSLARSAARGGIQFNRANALVDEIGNTIADIEDALTILLSEDDHLKRRRSTGMRSRSENGKEHGMLGFLKKGHHHELQAQLSVQEHPPSTEVLSRISTAVKQLKNQHSALSKSLQTHPALDTTFVSSPTLATTTEEDEEGPHTPSTATPAAGRMSFISSHSGDNGSIWFDAPEYDGPEEFVLDMTTADEGKSLHTDSRLTARTDMTDMTDVGSSIGADTDSESESDSPPPPPPVEPTAAAVVKRRSALPSGPVGDEGSLFAVLKKNVGKDLSKVALPVTFNEPLTMLQKAAEDLEYFHLLSQAANASDPVERMCFIAAFAVSTYANTRHKTGRKGFNPMLAETFEDVRMHFLAEKVCHNPVILAWHAQGEDWELYATSTGKTKFWGKSMEIIPQGTIHLNLGNEHYEWNRPSSFIRNLMMGTKYLEHVGKLEIKNTTSGDSCTLDFKEGGYWGPANVVTGTLSSASGSIVASLEGKWDEQMARKIDSSHLHVLWRITPFPKNANEYYGFTSFGITLNEITPDLEGRIAPTDSRYRPDVRALENGDLNVAEAEKVRVEELQRSRRAKGEERGPRWFKQVNEEWIYVGGYWEQRQKGWSEVEPLW
ncbi:Oxysterol-binding protein-domain-containing protein [Epithele typhae]|uniref:Oxysterol-binding protein-domain-containing protein n=1 Tax=Epithele typhae TaxID=378194 RepID=UPI002008BD82|nr:Oxysterol-binding protein-domain-containing protein [Epithele typhae]KAH9944530.1 Oxysterol-binding protein-domain-containing protein [Epithele typhae]